jgi:GNAT superfamily N-acetyltransferase
MILIRLTEEHLPRLAELDRSDPLQGIYEVQNDELVLTGLDHSMSGWNDVELQDCTRGLQTILSANGIVMGAQASGKLIACAGLSSVESHQYPDWRRIAYCFTDRNWRRKGLGSALLRALGREAERQGASSLFVPSLKTEESVDFWVRRGARLLPEVPSPWSSTYESAIPMRYDLKDI